MSIFNGISLQFRYNLIIIFRENYYMSTFRDEKMCTKSAIFKVSLLSNTKANDYKQI